MGFLCAKGLNFIENMEECKRSLKRVLEEGPVSPYMYYLPCPNNRRDAKKLLTLIDENVMPGTTVITDCCKSNDGLTANGFQHLTGNHSCHFVDP